jgi:hypothetical protein
MATAPSSGVNPTNNPPTAPRARSAHRSRPSAAASPLASRQGNAQNVATVMSKRAPAQRHLRISQALTPGPNPLAKSPSINPRQPAKTAKANSQNRTSLWAWPRNNSQRCTPAGRRTDGGLKDGRLALF